MKIYLDEDHIYRDEHGRTYTSVSKLINKYKKPFEKQAISAAIAKRDGVDQQELLDEWDLKSELSLLRGNYIHEIMEKCLTRPDLAPDLNYEIEKLRSILPSGRWVQEKIVADTQNLVAGTIDLITIGDTAQIWDFKTNDLDKPAYNNFLEPFQDLEQTKLNEYRLQLSYYKHLVEGYGYKVDALKIVNFQKGDIEIMDLEPIELWTPNT